VPSHPPPPHRRLARPRATRPNHHPTPPAANAPGHLHEPALVFSTGHARFPQPSSILHSTFHKIARARQYRPNQPGSAGHRTTAVPPDARRQCRPVYMCCSSFAQF
jgi:hypothetical protein